MWENLKSVAHWINVIAKGAPLSGVAIVLSIGWFLYPFRRDAGKWEKFVAGIIFLVAAWNIYDAISMSSQNM